MTARTAGAPPPDPANESAPELGGGGGRMGRRLGNVPIVQEAAAAAQAVEAAYRKRDATLKARAALAGIALHRLESGRWLASRWTLVRELDDAEVEDWLRRVEGSAR